MIMRAIEYNAWMTLLSFIPTKMREHASKYGLNGLNVNLKCPEDSKPAYPKDITEFDKPSIILQKVHTESGAICMGNFIGQVYDEDDNAYYDASGINHRLIMQTNIYGRTNTELSLLTDLMLDGVINRIYDDTNDIPLYDYIDSISAPVEIGVIQVDRDIDMMPMSSNNNNDYLNIIRFDINIVQSVVNKPSDMIDLGKGFKITQKIIL